MDINEQGTPRERATATVERLFPGLEVVPIALAVPKLGYTIATARNQISRNKFVVATIVRAGRRGVLRSTLINYFTKLEEEADAGGTPPLPIPCPQAGKRGRGRPARAKTGEAEQ